MNNKFLEIAACPICTELKGNFQTLTAVNDTHLGCSVGHVFHVLNGVPRLRPCDESSIKSSGHIIKYEETEFVDMFTLRQYGGLVRVKYEARDKYLCGAMLQVQSGGDAFYRTLLAFGKNLTPPQATVVDMGCGPGIIAGLIAKILPESTCVGIDFSTAMATRAHDIVTAAEGAVHLSLRESKTRLVDGELMRWGLSNTQFVVGDATIPPVLPSCADLVVASNLLHRTKEPAFAIRAMHRILKPRGHLLMSNSYDWKKEYTERELWFDNVADVMDEAQWSQVLDLDGVPFMVRTYDRKYDLALNHITAFQKK